MLCGKSLGDERANLVQGRFGRAGELPRGDTVRESTPTRFACKVPLRLTPRDFQSALSSIFTARMKSLSVRPPTWCVLTVISTLPQARKMSGGWPCCSPSSPTRFTNFEGLAKAVKFKGLRDVVLFDHAPATTASAR